MVPEEWDNFYRTGKGEWALWRVSTSRDSADLQMQACKEISPSYGARNSARAQESEMMQHKLCC